MKPIVLSIIVAISLAGCASAPTSLVADYSDEPVLIMVKGPGVAPTGNGFFDAIDFQILAGKAFTTERWSLEWPGRRQDETGRRPIQGQAVCLVPEGTDTDRSRDRRLHLRHDRP